MFASKPHILCNGAPEASVRSYPAFRTGDTTPEVLVAS